MLRPGLPPAAATVTMLLIAFLGIFLRAKPRSPRRLSGFVQRPGSPSVHHARGIRAKTCADLPLIDLLLRRDVSRPSSIHL